jgi:hypothetical protein
MGRIHSSPIIKRYLQVNHGYSYCKNPRDCEGFIVLRMLRCCAWVFKTTKSIQTSSRQNNRTSRSAFEEYSSYIGYDNSTLVDVWVNAVFPGSSTDHVLSELLRVIPNALISKVDELIWIATMFSREQLTFDEYIIWIGRIVQYYNLRSIDLFRAYTVLNKSPRKYGDDLMTYLTTSSNLGWHRNTSVPCTDDL